MTVTSEQARQCALALPEAVEQDHHGRPSFRVGGKIFATLWDEEHMNVMLDEGGILTAVESEPEVCAEVYWGKRLAAVRVDLRRADPQMLATLLREAWELRAPKRLLGARSSLAPASRLQCPAGRSQPSSTGGFQSVPTVFEPSTQGPSSGCGNFVCCSFSWIP